MSDEALPRVSARKAVEVPRGYTPGETAAQRLTPDLSPRRYLSLLIEHEEFVDAAHFLASALPRREAVWWACLCARQAAGLKPKAEYLAALDAAESWVADPTEETRRAAQPAAESAGFGTAAGTAAAAAFWSGGSLGPPNVAAIPPADHLTAHGAACSVMLAAVAIEPEKAVQRYQSFFKIGLEVAEGAQPWPEPQSRPAATAAAAEPPSPTPRISPAKGPHRP